jgi:D-alanine-D-alanine ligase
MKKKIALITGGYSGEAAISYKSADTISKNIDRERWDCYIIDIQTGGWFYNNGQDEKALVDKNDFSIEVNGNKIKFDAVLVGLHGTPGEDGKLLGYFDCLDIPYTSCNAATSALTFNKRYTVAVASFAGMPVAKSLHLFKEEPEATTAILNKLQLPLFVKPNNGGSSLGISKVNLAEELPAAIEKAFKEDDQVLVEEFIKGREFTIGVFKTNGKVQVLPITEIISKNEFFDFQAKYEGASDEITPAQIDESISGVLRDHARKTYQLFNCKGIVRIDYILEEKTNLPVLLEINTVPGQSAASLVPQQVAAMGWTLKEFYSALIEDCFI